MESGELVQPGGRRVVFSRYGPSDGRRVVFHYGTPGTRHLAPRWIDQLERRSIQELVLDRPGYGRSDRWPGRCIGDAADDVVSVADLLGWDRFAVWGISGGAPHALACAVRLPDRVERCAFVAGLAPFDAARMDWFADMSAGNVEEFSLARKGEPAYRPVAERLAREAVQAAQGGEIPIPDYYQLPEDDLEVYRSRVNDPGYLERVIAENTGGIDGCIDDSIALTRHWGFDPATVAVPISIWYGLHDVLSPPAHAEWLLADIPSAEGHVLPRGHSIDENDVEAIYDWLLSE